MNKKVEVMSSQNINLSLMEAIGRIGELTAEVAKYRKALGCIANSKDINAWLADIARNALKDSSP